MKVIGCDFGASSKVGDQAKKTIVLEADKRDSGAYHCLLSGRNTRLVAFMESKPNARPRNWKDNRAGWTIQDLATSLSSDHNVAVAAFDFPFSIPAELLHSASFADAVGTRPFQTRAAWLRFLKQRLSIAPSGSSASSTIEGMAGFNGWKDSKFWIKRATDVASVAQPPLKHQYQSVFNMTLLGALLLEKLQASGLQTVLTHEHTDVSKSRCVETYPALVARRIGVAGSYKQQPVKCLTAGINWLKSRGIRLTVPKRLRNACLNYESHPGDHDAVDSFLCLITAISVAENKAELLTGGAPIGQQQKEGAIVAPMN